jgi:hypothetical protein
MFHLKTSNMKKLMLVPMAVMFMTGIAVSNVNAQEKPKAAPKQETKAPEKKETKSVQASQKQTAPAKKEEAKPAGQAQPKAEPKK